MYKTIALLAVLLFPAQASAASCPERYRFVDFGLEGRDNVIRRGGTILRAFDEDNTHLLQPEATVCLDVERLATDGRALPVPVVSGIAFDLVHVEIGVSDLRIAAVEDVVQAGVVNAERHRSQMLKADVDVTRGEDFMCASKKGSDVVSCQVVSPYRVDAPLVVYCNAEACEMRVLGIDEQLVAMAVWPQAPRAPQDTGRDISQMVQRIFNFFETRF